MIYASYSPLLMTQKRYCSTFYENMFFVVSYPKLTVLSQFTMPEEAYFGNLSKISDRIWLLADEHRYRYFLFDSDSMQLMDEVVVSES